MATVTLPDRLPKSLVGMGKMNSPMTPLLALAVILPTLQHLYFDYKTFVSLGPGGTPPTIMGYLKVKALSFFALRDPYAPPPIPSYQKTKEGHLVSLPKRSGPRPEAKGIAPHRQVDQRSSEEIFAKLSEAIDEMAASTPYLETGTSCFEKHGTGLFSTSPKRRTCGGEICHAHPSDGSMHLTLHPADAKVMLEAGWGERHPLARGGWLERFVPGGFVMVYAPRTEEEVETVMEIVKAAIWWVGGKEVATAEEIRRDSGVEMGGNLKKGD
ncbi:hypothetical protein H2203_002915 [Taxawa tesnikishii (nom. ined.)]|nr:hypothetical protein H2203_002915 [Dothideales sp. JES 119]